MRPDLIRIEELAVEATIGVPEAERQNSQRLVLSITLTPTRNFRALDDDLQRTVDYADVAGAVSSFVRECRVKLIETLAEELAAHLLERFAVREVEIELRKFILPDAKYVSVRVTRARETSQPGG